MERISAWELFRGFNLQINLRDFTDFSIRGRVLSLEVEPGDSDFSRKSSGVYVTIGACF